MKQIKRLTALLLVLVMMFTFAPMAFAASEFTDVSPSDWYYAPVNWAVSKGITGGIGNNMFGPNNECPREQIVTFLWADAGKPEPTTAVSPFTDVSPSDWFFKPVMWAVENGITNGLTATEFGTGKTCTRAQVATFLWAAAGKPDYAAPAKGFLDVSSTDWFYKPVMWAVANEITSGIGNNNFGPNNNCTRAQIATFMYAASPDYVKPEPTPTPVPTPTPKPTPAPVTNEDRFEIACAMVTELNSVNGVDMTIYWRNNTGKALADITFNVSVLDYLGNVLASEIGGYTEFGCYVMDPPFLSGVSDDLYYAGIWDMVGKPHFAELKYDAVYDNYYYEDPNLIMQGGDRKVYVSPENINHTYSYTNWDAIMYNGRAQQIRVNSVNLVYVDGTRETIWNPKVGPRTSPEGDQLYTQQMKNNLGCDVVGHDANPTCTESAVCKRCLAVVPAVGHTYKYSETCTVCGERYQAYAELFLMRTPGTVWATDTRGTEYSFNITNVKTDAPNDVDVWIEDGVPEIRLNMDIYYEYGDQSFASIFMKNHKVTVEICNQDLECVYTGGFTALIGGDYKSLTVTLPASGKYYVDIYVEGEDLEDEQARIYASANNLMIKDGAVVTVTVDCAEGAFPNGYTVNAQFDESVLNVSWSEWNGNEIKLYINPINSGDTDIKLSLLEDPSVTFTISVMVI